MEPTEEDVQKLDDALDVVERLIDHADEQPDSQFDIDNLLIMREQLTMLHSGLSVVVAQQE